MTAISEATSLGSKDLMKLVTFRLPHRSEDRVGLLVEDHVIDLMVVAPRLEFRSMLALIEAGPAVWEHARSFVETPSGRGRVPLAQVQLRAPIPVPTQFRDSMCFHQHIRQCSISIARRRARESGVPGQ